MLLSLANKCIVDNGIYCPDYNKYDFMQYFDIYVVKYILTVLKLSSGISELMISCSRYITITSKKVTNNNNFKKRIKFTD